MQNVTMKRTALILLLLASVALAGCQTIRSHNPFRHREPAYKAAQQEQPLEVPPGMNAPPTNNALTIPSAGNGNATANAAAVPQAAAAQPAASTAPPAAGTESAGGSTTRSMTLTDTPDSVYHRVGLALARSDAGKVTAHDDAAHTYQVAVDSEVTAKPQGGFFHRLFHRSQRELVQGAVTVSVVASGSGSSVEASGDPAAVQRVMAVLQQRLK